MNIGFIGAGRMGTPICKHLIAGGHVLTVHDTAAEAIERVVALGARAAHSPAQAAEGAELVILSLPHPDISREVVLGTGGVLEGIAHGGLIAESSTVSPALVQELAPLTAARGVELLDTAVSGGVHGAVAATLTLMVGGSEAGFERLRPALSCFGKNLFHCGGPGMGMLFKVVNNMLSHVNYAALAEGLALGVTAGADPELLCDVIAVSSGRSAQIDDRARKHVLPGDFTPGMTTDLATKDSVLCLELARQHRVPTFIASAAHHIYEMAQGKGYGSLEYASLIKLWEEWLHIDTRARQR